MGRGLGPRQRSIIDQLGQSGGAFVSDLCDDPEDPNERKCVLSALRGLQQRGLVHTWREGNPARTVTEHRPTAGFGAGFRPVAELGAFGRTINETYAILTTPAP